MRVGILTVSDRVSRGEMPDGGGAAVAAALGDLEPSILHRVVPDDRAVIADALRQWSDTDCLDVIVTTGGTGLGPRDVTPEATLDVVRLRVPGIEEAIRAQGMRALPAAMLSRGVAGVRGCTLVVNLPGSPAGAREGAELVATVVVHAVALLHGDTRHG